MKTSLIVGLGVLLTGCGSDATTVTETIKSPAIEMPTASANPDPRIATIRQQHEQLLATQKEYITQLGQLKGNEKLSSARVIKSTGQFAGIIKQSQANLIALEQLNPSKWQDPSQVALIGEISEKQASLLARGERQLAGIHNEHYLPQ